MTPDEILAQHGPREAMEYDVAIVGAGPAPTITTSYSIDSRGPNWARISAGVMRVSRFVLVG